MRKVILVLKNLFIGIGYLASVITLIEFLKKIQIRHEKSITLFQNFDLNSVGQILQIIGLIIVFSGICIFIFMKIHNKYEPTRDLVDIIAPLLLSKDDIGDSEGKFVKKLRIFKFIRVGVIILIIGLVTLIITQFYK